METRVEMQIIHAQNQTINALVAVNVVVAVEDVSAMCNGFRYGFMYHLMKFFLFQRVVACVAFCNDDRG